MTERPDLSGRVRMDPARSTGVPGEARRREAGLTVFGWIWIALGAIRIASVPLRGAIASVNRSVPGAQEMIDKMEGLGTELPAGLGVAWRIVQNPVLNVLVGAAIVFTAVSFLRLKPWSRFGLELFAWLGVANAIVGGIVSIQLMDPMMEVVMGQSQGPPPPGFGMIVKGSALFGAFFSLLVPAGLLFLMRSRFVREPFARATAARGSTGID